MKENKKHKLIKHKGKLVPIAFGIIMPIVSVISAADNSNKPPSSKDKKSADEIQADNLAALKAEFIGGKVISTDHTAKKIASEIKDIQTLNTELGINLTNLDKKSTYTISASVDEDTSRIITVSVVMTTPGATNPKSKALTRTFKHKNEDDLVKEEKDPLQEENFKALKNALRGGAVTKVLDKAGDIAKRINDANALKDELGIDLTKLDKSSTYVISAEGDKDGKITVSVVMITKGTTKPKSEAVIHVVKHKSDVDLSNDKINAVNNTTVTTQPNKKSEVNFEHKPKEKDLTPPTQKGFTFTFKDATKVDKDGSSRVTYTIDVDPKVEGTTKNDITFKVLGFETKAQADKKSNTTIIIISVVFAILGLIIIIGIVYWIKKIKKNKS